MALIVFLRGINVGGRRTFCPALLASELAHYEVVNVGAAGTFVVRKPGPRAQFLAELRRRLPFQMEVAFCQAGELIRLEKENPFQAEPLSPDLIQFVSILSKPAGAKPLLPLALPEEDKWLVRILGARNRLLFGVYRRHMRTITNLGRIDKLFLAPATTRSWSTIQSVLQILKDDKHKAAE